jgi:hypothetical protein
VLPFSKWFFSAKASKKFKLATLKVSSSKKMDLLFPIPCPMLQAPEREQDEYPLKYSIVEQLFKFTITVKFIL